MPFGRLEAQITVPVAGWDGTINDSGAGGDVAWSVPAGTYFLPELLSELQTQLNAAAPTDTLTVSVGNGELGTGKVTIASGGGTFAITWIDLDLRDLLGYTGNLSGASTYLATNHARSLWIADCPYLAPNEVSPWGGWPEADFRTVENAAGVVWGFMGQLKETSFLRWETVKRSRASKANEATTGESFQRFVEEGVWGTAAWGTPTGPIRFFPDASASAFAKYSVTDLKQFRPEQFSDGWAAGPWKVELPRLVLIETGEQGRDTIVATHLTSAGSSVDGTTFDSASITVAAGELVLLAVCCSQTSTDAPPPSDVSETGAGTTLVATQIAQVDFDTTNPAHNCSLWRAMPAAPFTGTVTFTFPATVTACAWSIVKFAGVDTGGSNGATAVGNQAAQTGSTASGTALPLNLSALEHVTNRAFAAYFNDSNTVTMDPQAGFTEHGEGAIGSPGARAQTQSALTLTACDVSQASPTPLGGIAIEIRSGPL